MALEGHYHPNLVPAHCLLVLTSMLLLVPEQNSTQTPRSDLPNLDVYLFDGDRLLTTLRMVLELGKEAIPAIDMGRQ